MSGGGAYRFFDRGGRLRHARSSLAERRKAMSIELSIDRDVATVTISQPEKKNAISIEMREQLWTAFESLAENDAVRAVILTGAGEDVCAGMDVDAMGGGDVAWSLTKMRRLHRIARAIAALKKPTIAAVNGVCVGVGWSYALACDIVIASETARFAQIFRNVGLTPDGGAVWQLRQQIGAMRAKEIVYSGRMVGVDEALALGLVLEKVDGAGLLERAREIADSFRAAPTLALGMAKRQFELASSVSLDQFLEFEFAMQPLMSRTKDHVEGVTAFKERRPPSFKGG
jgi:2-(1,2-epoxy-1,2-dihydrophenyl)acetyl-CoA isomerase